MFAAEEGNYLGSLGIGFDTYKNDHPGAYPDDIGDNVLRANYSNSISVHFNANLLAQVDVGSAVDLASGQWIHTQIIMRPGAAIPDISVILTPSGGQPITVVNQFPVPGLAPYQGRVHFAGRSGHESSNHDLDNINVQFMDVSQTLLTLDAVSYTPAETQGTAKVTVRRIGGSGGPVSVNYSTANGSALAGSDYVSVLSTTLSLATGEMSKAFSVQIENDADLEGDETFLVSLSNPVGAVVGGTSTAGITIFDDERSRLVGNWSDPENWSVVAIHAHLLPTGQVMYWDRFGKGRLWNPATGEFTSPK